MDCYEAGPCGYQLYRLLSALGVACDIVAPALTPVAPGARVKTDRRDAKRLLVLHRAGALKFVAPPTSEQEGLRDLVRCRADLVAARRAARHLVAKQLLRDQLPARPPAVTFCHSMPFDSAQEARLVCFELNTVDQVCVDRGCGFELLEPATLREAGRPADARAADSGPSAACDYLVCGASPSQRTRLDLAHAARRGR